MYVIIYFYQMNLKSKKLFIIEIVALLIGIGGEERAPLTPPN